MNARSISALTAFAALGLSVATLTHCELAVDLDRSEVDGAVPDGCAICTDLTEGGEEGGEDATIGQDAAAADGGDADATPDAGPSEGASTDAVGDATPSDGGTDGAMDAGAGD